MENFYSRIYELVRRIPKGQVATYGQLAAMAGSPRASRIAGNALALYPDDSIPCHRVVDRFGRTKTAFDTYVPGTQRALLEAEGISFQMDGSIDLSRYQWVPDSETE